MPTPEVMTTEEAGKYLRISKRTLEDWRRRRVGPTYARVGHVVRYRKADLDTWLEQHREEAAK